MSQEIPKSTTFIQPTDSSAYTLSTDSSNLTSVSQNSTSNLQPGIETASIIAGVVSLLIALVVIFVISLSFYSKKNCRFWSTIKSTEKDNIRIQRQDKNEEEVEPCNIDNELDPIQTVKKEETSVKIENESVKREHGAKEYDLNCEPGMSEMIAIDECSYLELLFDFVSRQLCFADLHLVSTYLGEPQLADTAYIDGNLSETYCKLFHMWRCKYPRIDHKAKLKEVFSSMERQDLIESMEMFSKDSFCYKEALVNPTEPAQSSDFIIMSQNLAMESNHVLRFLGLKQSDIDQIKTDNRTTREKILRGLSKIQIERPSLTRQSICNALYYAGHSDVICMLNSSWNSADVVANIKPTERDKDIAEIHVKTEPKKNIPDVNDTDIFTEIGKRRPAVPKTGVNSSPEEGLGNEEEGKGVSSDTDEDDSSDSEDIDPFVGKYSAWETKISDEFSTLTDDEMSMLFCFLCSDSGLPDFTDTEWLDLFNEIRQCVYDKENPVTREEAQQILDRLKSRDYLWEDQDKITEDTKDETMYRIASKKYYIQFFYSSYDTANVYLRSREYNRKPGEKCVCGPAPGCDRLLIRRLQMNILTHVTMEDTYIYDKIHRILNIPENKIKKSKDEREKFLTELRSEGEAVHYRGRSQDSVDHVTWLWRYMLGARPDIVRSCIGVHPHWDIYIIDNKPYRKSSKIHSYEPEVRCQFYCLLISDKYRISFIEQSHRITKDKIRQRYFPDITDDGSVDSPDEITETRDDGMTFISEDIRHDVMYAFVTECLVEDSDLEFFLTTASRDVISEYCRSWEYKRSEGERCLYVPRFPKEMYDLFIDSLQLDIITHCTVFDSGIHPRISERLKIPQEVLFWDIDARKRFVKISSQGSVNMCRARGMIVGCAGAGKTTLLRRLQRENKEENKQPTETTVGLDIHEDLFEIKDDTLIDYERNGTKSDRTSSSTNGRQLISMTDFAGQVAYYACHQIYLSRRAFYIVVVDMSKDLEEKAMSYDTVRHSPIGSLFHNWTFADYFVFWLQSIKTYCEEGKSKESRSNETKANPVILIATHHDCLEQRKETMSSQTSFYDALERCLPSEHTLNDHISPTRYYEIECPLGDLNEKQKEAIEQVRKSVVRTAKSSPHWGEKIPHIWYMFEQFVQEHKTKRIFSRKSLKVDEKFYFLEENELDDMLRYFSEVGQIIYFSEEGLRHNIILDVGWFVDAFKNIITDPTHARSACSRVKEWDIFMKNGMISDSTLVGVWRENEKESYVLEKDNIIPYMEKLGILTKMKTQEVELKDVEMLEHRRESMYYIPSINKTDFTAEGFDLYNNGNKTPILVFSFKTFIPHFFFFRLVAMCFSKWKFLSEDRLCKNIAFYKEKGDDINIAIAVNKTSIQLQAFTPDNNINLENADTRQIRIQIEQMLEEITTTFHHQVLYELGYPCRDINITEEDEHCFLSEKTVAELKTNERVCPNFRNEGHEKHQIVRGDLLHYWYTGVDSRAQSS